MKMTKKRIIYTLAVVLIVVFSTTFAILMTLERMDYRNYLQGEYSKNMYQLIDSVRNIKVDLSKSAIVGSREQSIVVFGDIFRYADTANDKIHSLPISQQYIDGTSKFLSKVGDFAYALSKVTSSGKSLNSEEYKKIDDLKNQAEYLLAQLNDVQSQINQGEIKWGEVRKKAGKELKNSEGKLVSDKFNEIQKQVVQYPALIYDGPFSDNVLEIKPRVISQKKVSEAQAIEVAKKAIGKDKIESITKKQGDRKTTIPAYAFDVKLKDKDENAVLEVSENGGKIVYLLNNKQVKEEKIDLKKAIDIGTQYLQSMGYKNMNATYSLKGENSFTISYVYKQDGIAIYPDQVKLKVALDDGEIIGIEADKYLISHVDSRKMQEIKITEQQAKQRVGKNLKITSTKFAVIPTETNKEVLCYEFSGSYNDEKFIVYIDSKTGLERRILEIVNTPNGELTI